MLADEPPIDIQLHQAYLGSTGSVVKGDVISQSEAVILRRSGRDVVVCGSDLSANRAMARTIEATANGSVKRCRPHPNAGPKSLPHYQPDPRPPEGHTFYEKPLEAIMKFFTPELYLQYNSPDDRVADEADEAWEAAIHSYHLQLESSRTSMPPRILELASAQSLHDAELLTLRADFPGPGAVAVSSPMAAAISLKQDGQIVHLDYLLWGEVAQSAPPADWSYSSARVRWLYDEVACVEVSDRSDVDPTRRFWHRILLSDGRSIAIPFVDVIMDRFSPERPEPALVARVGRSLDGLSHAC